MEQATDKILNLLGLAQRAKKLAVGRSAVLDACDKGRAELVIACRPFKRDLRIFLEKLPAETPIYAMDLANEVLGARLGRAGVAVLAVTDKSFAVGLQAHLSDPFKPE